MISCPRCHHLNPDGETTCELCGADLGAPRPQGGGGETEPLSDGLPPEYESQPEVEPLVEGEPGDRTTEPEPEPAEPPPTEQASAAQAPTEAPLASALLEALDHDSAAEGRARGEGPQARGYFLQPLPVPDDLPVPGAGRAVASVEPRPELEPVSVVRDAEDESAFEGEQTVCPRCGAHNPENNRFCGGCGSRLPDEVFQKTPAAQAEVVPARSIALICINEDGSDGPRIALDGHESVLGRDSDERFRSDPFLSPRHATLVVDGGAVFLEDMASLNGTFVRIRESVRLREADCFLMGRQVLRLEPFRPKINPKATSEDGTRFMGSPIPGGAFRLVQVGIGGVEQNVYCLPAGGAVLGRERGDVTFPGDKFMSARHAQLTTEEDGQVYLTDLNSSNGTWIRIGSRYRLRDKDFIFLGQQLFRMHIA